MPDLPGGIELAPMPLPGPEDIPLDDLAELDGAALVLLLRWLRTGAAEERGSARFANYL